MATFQVLLMTSIKPNAFMQKQAVVSETVIFSRQGWNGVTLILQEYRVHELLSTQTW